jgi:hypothetical protein
MSGPLEWYTEPMAVLHETQRALNHFTDKYLDGVTHVIVDGHKGPLTMKRIREVKYWLGYEGGVNQQNSVVNTPFLERMWHPKDPRYSTPARIARGMVRRSRSRAAWKKNHNAANKTTGVGRFDGIPVANAAIPYLRWARDNGWQGRLVSGWRDPHYSQSLCYRMCGRPSCPGLCAGLSSNHVGSTADRFAVDVSDYVRFGELMRRYPGRHITNQLPRDRVHFSPSGN